jgi:FixJ family two-component response regulator
LESRTDITLLFTDINMPGSMDGLKLAHAVRDRWPPIKILVVSGKQQPRSSDLPSNSCFLGKPYQAATLVEELRSMVGPHNQVVASPPRRMSPFAQTFPEKECEGDCPYPTRSHRHARCPDNAGSGTETAYRHGQGADGP